mmetsp:Transcript_125877/g.402951  ORF Transcript_125877/g.402951 Transcript_125877/m.402951 type:complete len:212 (+) Transcript_125877:1487-2122(+)
MRLQTLVAGLLPRVVVGEQRLQDDLHVGVLGKDAALLGLVFVLLLIVLLVVVLLVVIPIYRHFLLLALALVSIRLLCRTRGRGQGGLQGIGAGGAIELGRRIGAARGAALSERLPSASRGVVRGRERLQGREHFGLGALARHGEVVRRHPRLGGSCVRLGLLRKCPALGLLCGCFFLNLPRQECLVVREEGQDPREIHLADDVLVGCEVFC